jgi:hypothetical protein
MDFRSTHILCVNEADNSLNFAAGGIMNRRTHHNSLCTDKNKHYVTDYVMVYKAMSHVTLPRMRELSPAPPLFAYNKLRLLSEYPL